MTDWKPGDLAEIKMKSYSDWEVAQKSSSGWRYPSGDIAAIPYDIRPLRIADDDEVILPREVAEMAYRDISLSSPARFDISDALDAQKPEPEPLRWPDGEAVEVGQLVTRVGVVGKIASLVGDSDFAVDVHVDWMGGGVVLSGAYTLNALARFTRPDVPTTLDSRVKCDDGSEWVLMDPEGLAGWARLPWDSTHTNWRSSGWIAQHIITVEREGVE